MGEIENESPVPVVEDHVETVRNVQVHSKPPPQIETDTVNQILALEDDKVNNMVAGRDDRDADEIDDLMLRRNEVADDKFDSDEDVGDIENEEVVEDIIQPVFDKKEEALSARQSVFERKEETFKAEAEPQEELFIPKNVKMTESKDTR